MITGETLQLQMIEHEAMKLLAETGTKTTFPLPLEKIARHIGFQCHYYIPDHDIADIIGTLSHAKRKFYINQQSTWSQQSMAIARLIGHVVLYGPKQDYISVKQPDSKQHKEYQLDCFAQALLMPTLVFKQKWQELEQNGRQLAEFFGVDELMVESRAKSLALLKIPA